MRDRAQYSVSICCLTASLTSFEDLAGGERSMERKTWRRSCAICRGLSVVRMVGEEEDDGVVQICYLRCWNFLSNSRCLISLDSTERQGWNG